MISDFGQRALIDHEVRSRARRVEIAVGRALAAALGDRHLRHADAFLGLAVLVGIEGQADALRRRDHLLQERHLVARRVGDAQHAGAAAKFVGAAVVALHALEDRQHVLVAPAAIAELRPVIVVLRLAADIDHAVDRTRAAQHPAAGNFDAPPARALVRLRGVAPVDGRVVDHLGDADRHARPEEVRAFGTRLEQQHPPGAALRQPAGDHRAGRTCTNDDVVIGRVARHCGWTPLLQAGEGWIFTNSEENQRSALMAREWQTIVRSVNAHASRSSALSALAEARREDKAMAGAQAAPLTTSCARRQ